MIARVEPLTTTRRLSGPFDYAPGEASVEVGSMVRVPFGRQKLDGVVVGLRRQTEVRRRAGHAHPCAQDAVPPTSWRSPVDGGRVLLDAPRALSLVLPPRPAAYGAVGAADGRPARGRAADGRAARAAAALPRVAAPDTARLRRWRRAGSSRSRRAAAAGAADHPPADRAVEITAGQRPRSTRSRRAARTCCTASRLGQDRGLPAGDRRALERGRGAIVLVPEIALTPQTVGALPGALRRHGRGAALRAGGGRALRRVAAARGGEARIAIGPRSAVFAPVRDLGLIVVDEEHDPSYKHESDPRYDARQWRVAGPAGTAGAAEADAAAAR